jgi:ABC-2 type transport system permease protein
MTAPMPAPLAPRSTGLPSQGAAFAAVYRLLLRSVATKGRLFAVGGLTGLSVLIALVVRSADLNDPLHAAIDSSVFNLSSLLPVGILVFGSATLGDPAEDGSLVYLWLRPVPSHVHVLAAWMVTVTVALPLVGLPLVASAFIIDPSSEVIWGVSLAMVVGLVAYSAIFVALGLRFRRALPWGLAYLLIWEGFVAGAGETASKLAISSYVRSVLAEATGMSIKRGDFTLISAVAVPFAVAVVALVYGSRRLARADVA